MNKMRYKIFCLFIYLLLLLLLLLLMMRAFAVAHENNRASCTPYALKTNR